MFRGLLAARLDLNSQAVFSPQDPRSFFSELLGIVTLTPATPPMALERSIMKFDQIRSDCLSIVGKSRLTVKKCNVASNLASV
jgi:hypothetical protein